MNKAKRATEIKKGNKAKKAIINAEISIIKTCIVQSKKYLNIDSPI